MTVSVRYRSLVNVGGNGLYGNKIFKSCSLEIITCVQIEHCSIFRSHGSDREQAPAKEQYLRECVGPNSII